jgi:hypothetical protein
VKDISKRIMVRSHPSKQTLEPIRKITKNNFFKKELIGMIQAIEHLPSNCEAPEFKPQ